ncbi:MAG TPA: GNAT family N-acyltransferase [Tepidisphaeraceae bacterium]|nr:GNAT family N-acyltransferase [Tepidisphaeraceae bacterium]
MKRGSHAFCSKLPTGTQWASQAIDRLFALDRLSDFYDDVVAHSPNEQLNPFLRQTLESINVRCHIPVEDLARIPKTGPLVIVANHPFGAIEGILLGSAISKVRTDLRIVANFLLQRIPELQRLFLFVDPFGSHNAKTSNLKSIREAVRWTKNGNALTIFPAGEVSHLSVKRRTIADPPWNAAAARIARMSGATVLPIYFAGANRPLFQFLGLVHPRLRTAMLPREFLALRDRTIDMRIGSPISPKQLAEFADDQASIDYLRQRTYLLQHRSPQVRSDRQPDTKAEPIAPPGDAIAIRSDVDALPADQVLLESGDYCVIIARVAQIPNLLNEIGRLREIAFRATGEGTGKSRDIDTFDYDYLHLVVWNRSKHEIVGGYRIGQTDVLLAGKGRQGLYTSTLFEYSDEALRRLTPGLELGRSFVSPNYQRSYSSLLLLWKGIGQFVVRNPKYKTLFGPVSISNTYRSASKQLMVRFLRVHHNANAQQLVTPKNPFHERRVGGLDDATLATFLDRDGDDLSALVSEIEPDQKGIPVLLRQYLKLGAKLLAINVDPKFSDVVDGLLMTDLTQTDRRVLARYMGDEGLRHFLAFHGMEP